MLKDAYYKYRKLGFILAKTGKNKKHAWREGAYIDRENEPFEDNATGYAGIIPPNIIIVDNDKYEKDNNFAKLVKDLGYTPEPFALTTSGGEHYAFENPNEDMVCGDTKQYKSIDIYGGYQSVIPIVGTVAINKKGDVGEYTWADFSEELIVNKWDDKMLDMFNMRKRGEASNTLADRDELEEMIIANDMPDEEVDAFLAQLPDELEYNDWIEVGMMLYDRYSGNAVGREKWVNFSNRSSKSDPDSPKYIDAGHKWDSGGIVPNRITYKRLRNMANEYGNDFEAEISDAKTEKDFEKIIEKIADTEKLHTRNKSDNDIRQTLATKMNERMKELDGVTVKQARTLVKSMASNKSGTNTSAYPDVGPKGKILPTLGNLVYFVNNISKLDFKYDVILKRIITNEKYEAEAGDQTIAYSMLSDELERRGLPNTMLVRHFEPMTFDSSRNGLLEHIESLPEWDGETDYIGMVAESITTKIAKPEYVRAVMQCVVIQAIAAWDNKVRTKHKLSRLESVLVFVGKQGGGKTTWVGNLMPDFMRYYFKDGVELDPSDKDKLIQVTSAGLVELGELDATTRKADISTLKSFLSLTTDEFRVPYGRFSEQYPRQTVFVGTVNNPDFLKDATGSRRFLTIDAQKLTLPSKEVVMGMWAQALSLYLNNTDWRLTDKLLTTQTDINKSFTDIGKAGDTAVQFVKAIEESTGKKIRMTITKILGEITKGDKFNSRERADFIAVLSNNGVDRGSQGKYYLPADVCEAFNILHNAEEFEDESEKEDW